MTVLSWQPGESLTVCSVQYFISLVRGLYCPGRIFRSVVATTQTLHTQGWHSLLFEGESSAATAQEENLTRAVKSWHMLLHRKRTPRNAGIYSHHVRHTWHSELCCILRKRYCRCTSGQQQQQQLFLKISTVVKCTSTGKTFLWN